MAQARASGKSFKENDTDFRDAEGDRMEFKVVARYVEVGVYPSDGYVQAAILIDSDSYLQQFNLRLGLDLVRCAKVNIAEPAII
ncbi:hypothetical protein DYGSA30_39460 [Dyella sp. GSA-30]|nr:hypothetical protein DYGSA30_39460 [Dyella sp. GSA-30]